ncbi:phosphoribosylformylglycinamidine synthase [Candidatus Daviesbacteria bacterium RIFCSPLOWO2_02_FULL_41_8]|uniref:Phosphoribosylformylglycinamidine synthase subunit PurL n=3 Tax=Candidatus Daviesiibacteriota TaxID=1752718 RepID=A0A1F5NLU7_9BACT|nr:MAG: phosphoribosylformylglycinamidine synthase [Candidatus Daviesbacteria bacterium RIFCSPHIGHO2_01_FULL_41_23]OGE78513.1 MAG: phosphoribosylformylglycinamidine synthase [Candidatus Daviesbacteria bacterium RIFCSPLOWO2_02_FULL_41_8]
MIQKVRVQTAGQDNIKVYRLEGASEKEAKVLAEKLLSERTNQKYTINQPIHLWGVQAHPRGVSAVEIAYKPGVMNPEVESIMKAASDLGIKLIACDSSTEYFSQKVSFNPLIEHIVTEEPQTLLIKEKPAKTRIIPVRNLNAQELLDLSNETLFLNLEEMQTIQKYFKKIKRDPTDLELETLAQTWSEHSGHKTFKADLIVDGKKKLPLMTRLKKEALKHDKNIVSAFSDNSGVMDFYDGFGICGKVETHNSPSAIEPYGGAMTGSGGVFRDIAATGKGAKNIASTDIFCFAPVDLPASELPVGCLPPEYLLKRVVTGVRDYGNRMGIPTNNGSVHFHKDFRAKPTVIVGAFGITPKKYAIKEKPKLGDLIICVGGKTGRDGIHGATFSSGEMTDQTMGVHSSAVQIGNAIEEKRIFDALLDARNENLIRLVQDCGGGGFSSAIGEIGEELGVSINLENAPLKYQGLAPWEIWMSESQERMIVVLQRKNLGKFKEICKKYNVEFAVLGQFDGSKKLNVSFGSEVVGNLDMKFLHQGLPKRVMKANKPSNVIPADAGIQRAISSQASLLNESRSELDPRLRGDDRVEQPKSEKEWVKVLEKVLAHGNVCSKEPIVRLYDHSVQGTNDLQPFSGINLDGPNDSPVLRPFLDKKYGVIISHGLNPVLNSIDPYWGSIWAATEALSNFVSVGGDYKEACLINNYVWPFPDEQSLWSLDRSVDAVVDFMKVFKIPIISGKDSLSSTYRGKDGVVIKIPPVLCISVLGKIPDTGKTVTTDFKQVGSTIVLVGKMSESLGGSTYFDVRPTYVGDPSLIAQDDITMVPKVDLKILSKTFDAIHKGIQTGKILSSHDISEGGIIGAIFEMCVGGDCGVEIELNTSDGGRLKRSGSHDSSHVLKESNEVKRPDQFLFNETAGCFIVEVENKSVAEQFFKSVPYKILGKTKEGNKMEIYGNEEKLFVADVNDLKKVWQEPMRRMFP